MGIALPHPQTLAWLQMAVPTTGTAWISVVTRAADIDKALGYIRITNPIMAVSGCMDHEPQNGLRWLHISLTQCRHTHSTAGSERLQQT